MLGVRKVERVPQREAINSLDLYCPSARASQVQTSWSLPPRADPHPAPPSGPSPPGSCDPLSTSPRGLTLRPVLTWPPETRTCLTRKECAMH